MDNSNEINIKSYNLSAEEYFKQVISFDALPQLDEFILKLKAGNKILDLGCGPGHHSKFFHDNGFKVIGVDFSSEMIKIAMREVRDVTFKVMDICELNFQADSFNGIWASASLLHIPKDKIFEVFKNLHTILNEGGVFYLSLKKGIGEHIIEDTRYGGISKYYSFYTTDEIVDYLQRAGFKISTIEEMEMRSFYDTNSWLHIFATKKNRNL